MHDMLLMFCEEQGQEASATDGIGRRRLWDHDKIIDVLDNNKGASGIRSIVLDLADVNMKSLHSRAFASMINMRYLQIYNTDCPQECARGIILNFPEGLQLPLGELRCLHWLKFPLKELPPDFNPKNLVDLKLPYSQIERVWEGNKDARKLKWIDFSHSRKLCTLSGLAEARNLQELNLEGCTALATLPQDMENMERLVFLNLRGCTNLKRLPKINLISMKILILTDCSLFEEFHFISESLLILNLSGCSILEEIKGLPKSIKELYLARTRIRELPEIPQSLEVLNANDCYHLKTVRLDFKQLPRHYTFSNCFTLSSETIAEFLEKGVTRVIMSAIEENQEHINKAPAFNMCFPADKQRYSTFFHWREGSCVTVELTPRTQKTLLGFAMSVLVSFPDKSHDLEDLGIMCTCTWGTKKGHFGKIERVFKCWTQTEAPRVEKDHMFVFYDSEIHPDAGEQTDSDDEIKFEFHTVSGENKLLGDTSCMVKGCGVKVITPPEVDKPVSGNTGGSEDICSIEVDTIVTDEETLPSPGAPEEHEYLQQKPEATSSSPSSIESHKRVKSKGIGIRKWIACFWPKNSKSRKRTTRVLQESNGKGKIKQVDDDDQIKHVHPRHSICSCRSTSGSDHEAVFPEFDVTSPHQRSYCINCRKPIAKHMVPKMQRSSVQLEPVESTTVSPTESMRAESSRCRPSWNK